MGLKTVIIQRVVPHYRLALFEKLYDRFGWTVATARATNNAGLNLARKQVPFVQEFPFIFPRRGDNFFCVVPVARILRETGAEAVISEFGLRMTSTYELLARRKLGGPVLAFWTHGFNASRGHRSPGDFASQYMHAKLLSSADACICYSEKGRNKLSEAMPPESVFVAPNTMDTSSLTALARRLGRQSAPGRPHLLSVGRALPSKQYPLLIQAFRMFKSSAPEAVLTIVGDGPDMEQMKLAQAGDPSVRLLGELYGEEVLAREFLSADLFVYTGSIGLGANHALAYGIPVMIFEQSPFGPYHAPEEANVIEGVTGFRVTPQTASGFAQALRNVFDQQASPREALADQIQAYVRSNLNLERMVDGFSDLSFHLNKVRTSRGV